MTTNEKIPASTPEANPESQSQITGRAVFVVNTTPAGITVETAFLGEDKSLRNFPAVFPDIVYALSQIDELRRLVLEHFSRAAQIGAQVMAAQAQQDASKSNTTADTDSEPTDADRAKAADLVGSR